jgi:DNA-binding GntR family transcriptional regulator
MEFDEVIERVRCEVRSMIRAGEIGPGERVNELHLAQRLNIGRNITREALRTLEYAGIVRIVPNKGAEVRKLSMEEALDLYEIRAGFARVAGRAAARRADRSEIARLNELQKQLVDIIATGDDLAYNRTNITFHAVLMAASHNPRLITMNAALEDELRLFMTRGTYAPGALRDSLAEHQEIITAIEQGRPDDAGEAFERHILNGRQRLIEGQIVMMI